MFSPIIVGMLGGMVAARFALRRARGGGCGRGMRGRFGRWQRRGFGSSPASSIDAAKLAVEHLSARLATLELNARQKEELEDTFAIVRDSAQVKSVTEWPLLEVALDAVATEPFDARALAGEPAVVVDALEHLHNILTPEQRATLRG